MTTRTVSWRVVDVPDEDWRCGYCRTPLVRRYAVLTVKNETNHFTSEVCEECGKLAEALFAAGLDFPGLELR